MTVGVYDNATSQWIRLVGKAFLKLSVALYSTVTASAFGLVHCETVTLSGASTAVLDGSGAYTAGKTSSTEIF